ncbi:hypothetical protein PZA11_002404 [Diplocarpon coronariae]
MDHSIRSALLGLSTHANDMEPLIFVIGFGAEQRALAAEEEDDQTCYTVSQSAFFAALNLGRTSMLAEIIRSTDVGIPLNDLVQKSGVEIRTKPRYYQGLNIFCLEDQTYGIVTKLVGTSQNMVVFKIGAKTDPKKLNQLVSLFDKAAVGGMLLERYTKKPVALKPISYWMADNCRSHRKPEIVTIPSKYSNGKDLAMINRKGYLLLHIAIKQSLGSITSFLLSLNPHDYNQVAHRPACEFINDENGPEESKQYTWEICAGVDADMA